jgi:hypothetical protein
MKAKSATVTTELSEFAKKSSLGEQWPLPSAEEWKDMSLDEVNTLVQRMCASYQEGAAILNQRVYDESRESGHYKCIICGKKKPQVVQNHPNYVWKDDRQDPVTRIYTSRYICSSECYFRGSNSGKLTNRGERGDVHK